MRKPEAICQATMDDPLRQLYWESAHARHVLERDGLQIRVATVADLDRVLAFLGTIWPDPYMYEPPYVLERALRYGFSLLLETATTGRLVAAQLAELYGDPDRTLQALRYAVAPAWRGAGLGRLLVREHACRAWEMRGARVRRGTVEATNTASLVTLLNHVGCVADGYSTRHDPPVLTVALPLTPRAMIGQRVDQAAAVEWIIRTGDPYVVVDPHDQTYLAGLAKQEWQAVAVLPLGQLLMLPSAARVWQPYAQVSDEQ